MLAMRVDAGSHVAVARSRDELVAAVERGAAGVVYVFEDFNARECDEVMAAGADAYLSASEPEVLEAAVRALASSSSPEG